MKSDGSGQPRIEKDLEIRIPKELFHEPGVTLATVKVYAAIRSRVGFEPTAENFLIAWPALQTIAEDAGVSRDSAIDAVRFLQDLDYLYVERRSNRSSVYMVIVRRIWFRDMIAKRGRSYALHEFEKWRQELADERRSGQAEAASERRPRQERNSGRKWNARHSPVTSATPLLQRSEGSDLGSGVDPTSVVGAAPPGGGVDSTRSVFHRSAVQGTVTQGIGGSADAEPARALEERSEELRTADQDPAPSEDAPALGAKLPPTTKPMVAQMTEAEREARLRQLKAMTVGWKEHGA